LGEHDQPVAAGEQQRADERRTAELGTFDAQRAPPMTQDEPRAEQGAGEQVAKPRGEERWQGLDRDRDREIRRSPDEVDDPERGPLERPR
jgi:hypothetical protein